MKSFDSREGYLTTLERFVEGADSDDEETEDYITLGEYEDQGDIDDDSDEDDGSEDKDYDDLGEVGFAYMAACQYAETEGADDSIITEISKALMVHFKMHRPQTLSTHQEFLLFLDREKAHSKLTP